MGCKLKWNQKTGTSDTEVTWEDQQNINKFGRLNNRLHELEDEIKIAKVHFSPSQQISMFIKFIHVFEFIYCELK